MPKVLLNNLQAYVESLVEKHQVPAASLAVWHSNQLYRAAAGVLNKETGTTASPDSIFQIGSITKVFTASLVMQLVDEGRVELDRPVKHYLPDFQIADPSATKTITVRQLLNHTNGMMGDFFPDDAHAEGNLIARYVDRCNLLPQIHPPGTHYSYSNAAFAIAGRLIEVVLGVSWFTAIEERIFTPLGMQTAIARPTEVLRFSTAMGHVLSPESSEKWRLADECYLTLGQAPAGSTLMMSASDLIKFAKAHLDQGQTESGGSWLSSNAVNQMQESQFPLPPLSGVFDQFVGIGWGKSVFKQSGTTMISHNGATLGFESMLRLIPEQNLAFAVLVNGVEPGVMANIGGELMATLTGIDLKEPEPIYHIAQGTSLDQFVGRYESFNSVYTVTLNDDHLVATLLYKIDPVPPLTLKLIPIGKSVFATYHEDDQRLANIAFIFDDTSETPGYLYAEGRLNIHSQGGI
jgi:CubicO group peptidase (beta-lactamase class C family)